MTSLVEDQGGAIKVEARKHQVTRDIMARLRTALLRLDRLDKWKMSFLLDINEKIKAMSGKPTSTDKQLDKLREILHKLGI